jgi:hypothetical protein
MLRIVPVFLWFIGLAQLSAQMNYKSQSLYGNEWIKSGLEYYKIKVGEDGLYRISYDQLQQAGVPVATVSADKFRLYHLGIEVPLIRSSIGIMGISDFIMFYGYKNRSALDEPLFESPNQLMNPEFSMFSDTSAYYLSWESTASTAIVQKIQNDLSAPLPKDEYYYNTKISVFSEYHFKRGVGQQHDQKFPLFDPCQGFSTKTFQSRSFPLDMENANILGPDVRIKISLSGYGQDATAHRVNFIVNGNQIDNDIFAGYKMRHREITFPSANIKSQNTLKIDAVASPEDNIAVSVIRYTYPCHFTFNQKKIAKIILEPGLIRKYLEIENFDGGDEIIVYDLTNNFYLNSVREGNGIYRITIPVSSLTREILILNKSEIKNAAALQKINMPVFSPGNTDFVMVYNPRLKNSVDGRDYVQEYIDYRSSPQGGSFKVSAINIETLYDVFAYGIYTHPLAIRNFAQYSKTIWPNASYFLIIGKGVEYPGYRTQGIDTTFFFVPTFSSPAADIILVADGNNNPMYAFGRIPVINAHELKIYLDKVKSHEDFLRSSQHTIEFKEWQKRVVHLSGGDPLIYQWISNELKSMQDTIENNVYGAKVETFYKQSSSNIEVSNSEKLKSAINEGTSIIAFLGHSAAIRLDFNLENVDSYKNKNKYHMFMAMGCYAGSMFSNNRSISEEHNLAPEKGSIIYLANTTAGYPNILGIYGRDLYSQLGRKYYAKPIGDAVKATFSSLQQLGGETLLTQAYSTSFNGDPAIRLNLNPSVDYTLDAKTVTTNPSLVFNSQNSFELKFDVVSLGAYIKDSILLTIDKKLPDGKITTVYNSKIANPSSRNTMTIPIPVGGDDAIGFNTLYIKLDANDEIAEGPLPDAENNNELNLNGERGYSFYIFGNEARPVYPPEFAIINKKNPRLIASNGNTLASVIDYYMELDTTEYFNSPFKKSTIVKQTGGVINWQPNVELKNNTVYYWRTAPDSIGSGVFAWRNSSFVYLENSSEGWNQSHFFQHRKNDFYKMKIQEPERSFRYADQFIDIKANNGYIELPTYIRPRVYVGTDVASDYQYWNHTANYSGVVMNVFDPVTGRLWINKTGGDFNSYYQAGFINQPFFIFKTSNTAERTALMEFLENGIPDDHVVIFSTLSQYQYSYFPEQWESDGPKNLYTVLESFGAQEVRNLKSLNSVPYIMVFRKGRTDFEVKESVGNFTNENEITHTFSILQTSGSIQSRLVGPSKSWSRFLWDYKGFEPTDDNQEINIFGILANGTEEQLFGPFTYSDQNLTGVDASKYPRLKLEWKSTDTTSRSTPDMDYWRVLYEGYPDAAFNAALLFEKKRDTVNQGDDFEIKIAAQNIGVSGLDSLLVKFTIVNQLNQQTSSYKRFIPLASLETVTIPFVFKTSSVYGAHKLFIELNPDNDQVELNTFNNTAIIPFFVRRDKRKPYMEVTFDRLKIINEDIVSSKAVIEIILQDENKDLLIKDTSVFILKIKEPGGTARRVYFAQNNVSFVPAGTSDNKVKAIIQGDFKKDGVHTLYVTAYDGSGNAAGDQEYIVDFTIVTKSSVGNLFNYPNPFTSKTRFVYTLTGDVLPDNYMIQIMTVSGKVVKTITKEELGPLTIGTHMTDYEYNATDDFGEKLANGVYLYRFIVNDKSKSAWDKYDTKTDQYFKENFGKMVIIR